MIKVDISSNSEFTQITDDITQFDVIINMGICFVNVLIPDYNKIPYPIPPSGALWLTEEFKGKAYAIINKNVLPVKQNSVSTLRLMTLEEFSIQPTEIS